MSWYDEEESFLRKLENQCDAYQAVQEKDYRYYNRKSKQYNIPILIISAINALTAIALNEFMAQKYVSILNAVLSAGTGVLGSIQLYLKLSERMSNSLRTGMLMKRLALKISMELSIDRLQRPTDGQVFMHECFGEFNAAIEQANPIEKRVKNFMKLSDQILILEPRAKTLSDLAGAACTGDDSLSEPGSLQSLTEEDLEEGPPTAPGGER